MPRTLIRVNCHRGDGGSWEFAVIRRGWTHIFTHDDDGNEKFDEWRVQCATGHSVHLVMFGFDPGEHFRQLLPWEYLE